MENTSALEAQKKYKIEKALEKLEQKKLKRLEGESKKYQNLTETQLEKIREKYQKRLQRRLSKLSKEYERKRIDTKKKLQGKEVKVREKKENWKAKAKREFCKYCKLSRADNEGYVWLLDTGEKVKRNKSVGGHFYPFHNFPQLAFNVDNCWPISSQTNRMQADNIGIRWYRGIVAQLGVSAMGIMKDIAEDAIMKSIIRDNNYYREIYEHFRLRNEVELKRLGLTDI